MPVDAEAAEDHTAYSHFDIDSTAVTGQEVPYTESCRAEGQSYWLGRIFVMKLAGRELYIGPHWYCSILMLAFILGVGVFHCTSVAALGWLQLCGGFAVTGSSLLSFLNCAFADPGILHKNPEEQLPSLSEANHRTCQICQVVQPRGCQHCHFCQVCILGHDHHCPWMGKCIGRKNLCAFYTFLTVSFASLGYVMLSALTLPPP
mmetsp:Transcript_53243/g.65276  ORF Transcript_53243/g.65276 Transcript_53243/m.65276 type:complete len:204 (-) Transcript_53243:72-683(-)